MYLQCMEKTSAPVSDLHARAPKGAMKTQLCEYSRFLPGSTRQVGPTCRGPDRRWQGQKVPSTLGRQFCVGANGGKDLASRSHPAGGTYLLGARQKVPGTWEGSMTLERMEEKISLPGPTRQVGPTCCQFSLRLGGREEHLPVVSAYLRPQSGCAGLVAEAARLQRNPHTAEPNG